MVAFVPTQGKPQLPEAQDETWYIRKSSNGQGWSYGARIFESAVENW